MFKIILCACLRNFIVEEKNIHDNDNDLEIESKYQHYNLCLALFNNSYLEFTRWHYCSEYVFLTFLEIQ